ncbi:hypothetical protein HCY81_01595 [Limosilactobacillus fermentum]
MATASDAKSDATVAIQTASGASLTATNAQGDATIAKQTASQATVQASNAESDFAQLSIRANKIEANVANNSGAIASVQQTANGLTTTVADIKANGGGVNLITGTSRDLKTAPDSPSRYNGGYIHAFSSDELSSLAGNQVTARAFIHNTTAHTVNLVIWIDVGGFGVGTGVPAGTDGYSTITAYNINPKATKGDISVRSYTENAAISGVQYKEFEVEKGTVAHDWSPAPEDLQNQFTQTKQSIDGITTTINDPKTGLNATYQTASGNATTISNAQGDIAKLKTRADGFEAEFTTANGNISKLQTDANGTTQTLANTKSDVAVLQSRADGLDAKYATAAGDINTLKTNASGFSQTLTNAQGDISTLKSTVSGVQTTLTDAQGNISTLQSDVSGLKKTTSDHTGSIATLQATANTLTSQMSSAQGDISTLKQTASGISSQVSGMSGDLNNLKSQAQWVIVTDTVDLNNIKTPCHEFLKGGVTNAPNEVAWWYLTVEGSESERITQTVIADQSNNRYTRRFADSWSAWVKVANQNDIDTLNGKITANTTAIEQNKKAITLKADQTTVDKANGTVQQLQSQLKVQADQINSKVSSSDLDAKGYATQTYTQTQVKQTADAWNANLTSVKNGLTQSYTNLHATVDGIQAEVYNKDGSSKITQLSNLIATKVSSGDYNSQINQLKNDINLRVAKGDVISQINQEAGGNTLIQVSNGKKSLILDAGNTIITGKAWIPSAAIANLTADDITTGTLKGVDIDFRNSSGQGVLIKDSTVTFDDGASGNKAGYLSFSSMPIADWPNGTGGNELQIKYGESLAIVATSDTNSRALFSTANTQIGYHQQGDTSANWGLTGLKIDNSSRQINLGVYGSDGKWARLLANSGNVELNAGDAHCNLDGGRLHFYKDNDNNSPIAVELQVDGWAWVRGWVEAAGHSTHSALSTKTDIQPVDDDQMLKMVNDTDLTTYLYKTDVASGETHHHIGLIIDDVHDVAQYQTPQEFIAPNGVSRDDDNMIGALFGAVKALTKRIKTLEEKTK